MVHRKYPYQRATTNLKVPYFVKDGFERDYRDNIKNVEKHVEETFVSNLQSSCFRERNYSKSPSLLYVYSQSNLLYSYDSLQKKICDIRPVSIVILSLKRRLATFQHHHVPVFKKLNSHIIDFFL